MERRDLLKGIVVAGGMLCMPPAFAASRSVRVPNSYVEAAKKHGIPPIHMYALAVKESNEPKRGKPNPFAMNFKGKSYYFESQQELFLNAQYLVENSQTIFDLGPVQVNWHWHSESFEDLWDATNPFKSLDVGAAYFRKQFEKTGDWFEAAGRYHSFTPDKARTYRRDYEAVYRRIVNA
ncbi:transglycosylase SLT domain-containing protein [Vibrio tubiashii]|uniref:transglycosylase SLT domain-containing protein n=1 Tax=Vibrio tubiashii TaxID=29498 RepID=UPI001EFD812A|nr:transglycosylase SLT domain-containing protein [Vibrio tubiashii]MCG9576643.1 transglycosylase SLT domain-containing protein [Vibrio tubiashii]